MRFDRTSHLALIALAPTALLVLAEDAGDGLNAEALQEGGPAGETTEDTDAALQADGPFDGGYPPRPGIWAGSPRPTDAVASNPDTAPRLQPPPWICLKPGRLTDTCCVNAGGAQVGCGN